MEPPAARLGEFFYASGPVVAAPWDTTSPAGVNTQAR
jgi:hypothetical protein